MPKFTSILWLLWRYLFGTAVSALVLWLPLGLWPGRFKPAVGFLVMFSVVMLVIDATATAIEARRSPASKRDEATIKIMILGYVCVLILLDVPLWIYGPRNLYGPFVLLYPCVVFAMICLLNKR